MTTQESITSVQAHTVPSNWIGRQALENNGWHDVTTAEPFERVVGLTTGEGDEVWAPEKFETDSSSTFIKGHTQSRELPFSGVQAFRLMSFFQKFLSAEVAGSIKSDYNCHRFAAWMQGLTGEDTLILIDMDSEASPQTGNLGVGETGMIISRDGSENGGPNFHHSVIGLGEDSPECLQVMWPFGHLGITSYSNVLDFYRQRLSRHYDQPAVKVDVALYA